MKNKSKILLAIFAMFAQGAYAAATGAQSLKQKMLNKAKGVANNLKSGAAKVFHKAQAQAQAQAHGKNLAPQNQGTQPAVVGNPNAVAPQGQGEMVIEDGQAQAQQQQVIQPVQGTQPAVVGNPNAVAPQGQGEMVIEDGQAQAQQQQVVQPAGLQGPQQPITEEHIDAAADKGADVLEQQAAPQQAGDEDKSPIQLAAEGKQIISETEQTAPQEHKDLAEMITQNLNTEQLVEKGTEEVKAQVEVPAEDVQQAHQEVAVQTGTAAPSTEVQNPATEQQQQAPAQPETPKTEEEKAKDLENSADVLANGLQGSPQDQAEFQEMIKQLAVSFTEGLEEEKANEVLAEHSVPEAARAAIIIAAHNLAADIARKKVSEAVVEESVDQAQQTGAETAQQTAAPAEQTQQQTNEQPVA